MVEGRIPWLQSGECQFSTGLRLSTHLTWVSMRYITVRITAFCHIFQNCDHWTPGSMHMIWVCTGSFTPKCAATDLSVYCQNLLSDRDAPRQEPSSYTGSLARTSSRI